MIEFEEYLQSLEYSTSTIQTHTKCTKTFHIWLENEGIEASDCSHNDLMGYVHQLRLKGLKQSSIQHYLVSIKHYFDLLIRLGQVNVNPATRIEIKGVKRKSLYHILEPEDLMHLYESYPINRLEDRRNKVIAGLLLFQALRTIELSKLELSSMKLNKGVVDIIGGRNSESRNLTLQPFQILDLMRYIEEVRPELAALPLKRKSQTSNSSLSLFVSQGGNDTNFSGIMHQVVSTLGALNSQIQNAHQIRTSVIVSWLRRHNLREVQYMAGHRYVSSTESYLMNDMEGLIEEVNQFHPLG